MEAYVSIKSPIGPLCLVESDAALIRIEFGEHGQANGSTPLMREAIRQLQTYFDGELRAFSLPLRPVGTPFQQRVWQALMDIPYGETRSYADIAVQVGCPKGTRAVGMANHRNPLPIVIPCHRVIGKNGTLTGYAGGLAIKEALLALERGV